METREQNLHLALGKIRNLIRFRQKKDFVTFFKDYLISYGKRDYRVMKQAYDKYILFMTLNKDMKNLHTPDSDTIRSFAEFLKNTSRGTGAASTYGRFRKAVLSAVRQGIMKENPCSEIKCSKGNDDLIKDILSEEEIRTLTRSHYHQENPEIRKAFIFSLYTGIRFCDVRSLKYSNVDYANRLITFEQSKTKSSSSRCFAYIPLREDLMKLIGDDSNRLSDKNELIFHLPSHPTCLKHLRKWTKSAGIDKHITWHCARHSFATNILKNGADIKVVAELLGHSGLKYVEKYTRAVDKMKMAAVNSLPPIG